MTHHRLWLKHDLPRFCPSMLSSLAGAALPHRGVMEKPEMNLLVAIACLPTFIASLASATYREELTVAPRLAKLERIAARVRQLPIYEWEVQQAVRMRVLELPYVADWKAQERDLFQQE